MIWREGELRTLAVTIGEVPAEGLAEPATTAPEPTAATNPFGLVLSEAPPAMRRQLGIEYGLVVRAVTRAAAGVPVRPGDVILGVNQQRFASLAEFNRLLAAVPSGEPVALLVRRGDVATYVVAPAPAERSVVRR